MYVDMSEREKRKFALLDIQVGHKRIFKVYTLCRWPSNNPEQWQQTAIGCVQISIYRLNISVDIQNIVYTC